MSVVSRNSFPLLVDSVLQIEAVERTVEEAGSQPVAIANSDGETNLSSLDQLFDAFGLEDRERKQTCDDLAVKEEQKKKLMRQFANIGALEHCYGKRAENGFFAPHANLLNNHNKSTATKLLLAYMMHDSPSLTGDKEYAKAQYFINVLHILRAELELFTLHKDFAQSSSACRALEKILFRIMPVKFVGQMFFSQAPVWDLRSTEGFACYLRFTQRLQACQADVAERLTVEDKKILKNMVSRRDPSVLAQATYFSVKWRQSEQSEKLSNLNKSLTQLLAAANAQMAHQPLVGICKQLTPAFGFLLTLLLDEFRTLQSSDTYSWETDPQYVYYLPLVEKFLQNLCKNYFDKQVSIYQKAFEELHTLMGKNSQINQAFDEVCRNLTPPEEVARSLQAIKERYQTTSHAHACSSDDFLARLIEEEEAKHPVKAHKQESTQVQKKRGAATHQIVQTASRKIERVQKTSVTSFPSVSSLCRSVMQAMQVPHPVIWHQRIKRWLALDPSRVDEIRHFTDRREGDIVRLYQNLNESDLVTQLLLHGFSPLVDKVLGDSALRQKYSQKTERGVALVIEIIHPTLPAQKAIIFYGLENNFCFHRKIEMKEDRLFLFQTIPQLASSALVAADASDRDQQALTEELASGFEGDSVEIDEQLEILKFIDRKNGHQINLFPLR